MRRTIPLVALAVLALLAGCSGGLGLGADSPTGETTASPTDDSLGDTPPGLSEENITDGFALADAHADALANTGFTVRTDRTLTADNGTRLEDVTEVRRVAANHSHVAAEATFDGSQGRMLGTPVDRVDSWFDGSRLLYRLRGPNGTEYAAFNLNDSTVDVVDPTEWKALRSYYLHAESSTVSAANGSIELRMNVTREDSNAASGPAVDVTERTVTVTMTESGLVERYRVEYAGQLADDPDTSVEGVRVVEFAALGETSVERPDWLPAARNASADG